MAVKKAIAKKSVAKKAAVKATKKKATSKTTPVKKSAVKKAATKKSVVKKTAVKKTTLKKATIAKKAPIKKSVKKKATSKTSTRKSPESIVIPEAPISAARSARVEIVSTPASSIVVPAPTLTPAPTPSTKPGTSGRVIFAVAIGIILLGVIVWAKSHNPTSTPTASPTPTATASASPTATNSATPTPTASATSAVLTAHSVPQGVVAHYTANGATIYWTAPTATDGLTGYNVEISVSNGPWKLISTVPETQLSLDVTKESATGWTSFKVSSVYSDSQTASAKAFGLPGTYS